MSSLTVNIDLTTLLRAARRLNEPDPAQVAMLAELAGADGISVQVRRDKKYIHYRDLYILKGVVKSRLILELPPVEELIEKALEIKPWMVLFVADLADSDSPVSTIDFNTVSIDFSEIINRFSGSGVNTGFFVEPESDEIKGAAKSGASAVLINCSGYTEARTIEDAQIELDKVDNTANTAVKSNMIVYCGRGLNYKNVRPLVELDNIDDFIIGHAISSRAFLVGFERAVREMLTLISEH